MFEKVSTELNFVEHEKEVEKLWRERNVFKRSIDQREGCDVFTFYDGPPTANGKPHIGHILTRVMKDMIPRYRTMKGYKVLRKAGWDTHGLPVELEVEKKLGLDGKKQIEAYGMESFIKQCKESVWKYLHEWERMSERIGYWADMENPYVTYDNNYIESVWWSLKRIHEMGLLYKGYKVVPYCPRCGTALSSHEVAQGYKDVEDMTAFVRFKVRGEDKYLMAWTTTPWTLPSNVALCVNADEDYTEFKWDGRVCIMAKALIKQVVGDAEIEEIKTVKGAELVGMEYEPLFNCADTAGKKAFYVVADGYVTLTEGTGIVHIAPAFGEDDARVGHQNDLPFVQLVGPDGKFVEGTPWAGTFVKQADPTILDELEQKGLLVKKEKHSHNYPFCWRCDTPLIYYARSTWFIRMTAVRDNLVANNRSVNWLPDNIKEGRMGNFLENVIDWGLSRERYWGTPLPIWTCECGHMHVIGSIEELKRMGNNVPDDIELHRPYIDQVTLTCPECGGVMHRVPEVIDCWYDSGSMPFAQWHYPFENQDKFEENFPADFISEAIDQTRGWFYTLLAISTLLFGRAPFKNCLVLGHVLDKYGKKMSKHTGNVVDPFEVMDKFGADAVRWYFYTAGAPWLPSRFYPEAVAESQRKFMGTLWNTYAFFALYASIDTFDPLKHHAAPETLTLMDRWILSKLQTLIKTVDDGLANYRITESANALGDFVDELSNWYVRRCRERFWGKGMEGDKLAAFDTLYRVLVTLTKLCAPFVPFMSESMYQNLVVANDPDAPDSVHLTDFPVADESLISEELERNMERVILAVQLGRACRSSANIKTRQPCQKLLMRCEELPADFASLIADELNVKQIEYVNDASAFTGYRIKPQLRTVGPKYGKLLGGIRKCLETVDGNAVVEAFERGEKLCFEVNGQPVELAKEDTLIEPMQVEGFDAESAKGMTVVLDTRMTDELISEGFGREVISKLQTMRKDAGYEVVDRIGVSLTGTERLMSMILPQRESIMKSVLAVEYSDEIPEGAYTAEWNINGESAKFACWKVAK